MDQRPVDLDPGHVRASLDGAVRGETRAEVLRVPGETFPACVGHGEIKAGAWN